MPSDPVLVRSPRARRLALGTATVAAVAAAVAFLPTRPVGRPTWHEPAPSFSVKSLDGERVRLEGLRGQVVLVNFWATWCPPCRQEMPAFQAAYEEYRSRGFTVVGLSMDVGGKAAVLDYLREAGVTYPVAMTPERVRLDYGGVSMLPHSLLIDREGKVRKIVRGRFDEETLRRGVGELLAEDPGRGSTTSSPTPP